jgi:hypothetical protein
MFVMANNIEALSIYFLLQVMLILYIQEMAMRIESLLNREILRAYLQEKTGHMVSEVELDAFLGYLQGVIRRRNWMESTRHMPEREPLLPNTNDDPFIRRETIARALSFLLITWILGAIISSLSCVLTGNVTINPSNWLDWKAADTPTGQACEIIISIFLYPILILACIVCVCCCRRCETQ